MILTPAAIDKVDQLLKNEQEGLFLRLAVQPGGCSGLKYQIYFDHTALDEDNVLPFSSFNLHVDKMSYPYVTDATMDYVDRIDKQGFTIDNPAAHGTCACGDSFN
jgi:iron-sulfur cluster assembly accessory protein